MLFVSSREARLRPHQAVFLLQEGRKTWRGKAYVDMSITSLKGQRATRWGLRVALGLEQLYAHDLRRRCPASHYAAWREPRRRRVRSRHTVPYSSPWPPPVSARSAREHLLPARFSIFRMCPAFRRGPLFEYRSKCQLRVEMVAARRDPLPLRA